jgi:site-specific recombinase XerD
LTLLSSAYSLAVKYDKAESNPCSKVDLFTLDNLRYRYLMPDEEPRLMAALTGPRAHLQPIVTVALGTGIRLGEQLCLKKRQVDFLRNMVTPTETKNGKDRDIPMNVEVRAAWSSFVITSPAMTMFSRVLKLTDVLKRSKKDSRLRYVSLELKG